MTSLIAVTVIRLLIAPIRPAAAIIQTLPYDRVRTSMKHFTMCSECTAEYTDPSSRRYHAEPISCPGGPKLKFLDNKGDEIGGDPIDWQSKCSKGKIIALKGLGDFILMHATSMPLWLSDCANIVKPNRLR